MMYMSKRCYLILIVSICASFLIGVNSLQAQVISAYTYITRIQIDSDTGYIYFVANQWGIPDCPNLIYAMIPDTNKIRFELLALGMFAKKNNIRVQVHSDNCNSSSVYLPVKYLILE